jgi:hypothetical protein
MSKRGREGSASPANSGNKRKRNRTHDAETPGCHNKSDSRTHHGQPQVHHVVVRAGAVLTSFNGRRRHTLLHRLPGH